MNVVVAAIGSAGDVYPFVGLALALRARGHRVTLVSNGYLEPLAGRGGLEFFELPEFRTGLGKRRPFWTVPRARIEADLLSQIRRLHEVIAARHGVEPTVVAASIFAFGARVAHETLGVPLATIHVQPMMLRSVHQAPLMPGLSMPDWSPRLWKRFLYGLADVVYLDRVFAPAINRFRAERGLPPVRRVFDGWLASPQRIIGLFPRWFAPLQPDWPPQTRLTGFLPYDGGDDGELPADVERFFDAADPPIVFTASSWVRAGHPSMEHMRRFFAESVDACRRLGRRAALLTQSAELVPAGLPEGVRRFGYVPLSRVLSRSAALVHHGGIGTGALALAAGVPQLVLPRVIDQPDNAARLARLGVALTLSPRAYRAATVADAVERLLGSPQILAHCRTAAARLRSIDPVNETCRWIEALVP